MTDSPAKVKTIDLRDLVGQDELYAPPVARETKGRPPANDDKDRMVVARSSRSDSRRPTEDARPPTDPEVDYQSKLLQSTTDDRNKDSKPSPEQPKTPHSRDSVDPFTVSMRETAKLEIENLNTQQVLLEKIMEA